MTPIKLKAGHLLLRVDEVWFNYFGRADAGQGKGSLLLEK
jgi:hypothetical protein